MAIPAKLYEHLMPPMGSMEDKPQFEGKNMEVLVVLSDFLYRRLVISRAVINFQHLFISHFNLYLQTGCCNVCSRGQKFDGKCLANSDSFEPGLLGTETNEEIFKVENSSFFD